MERFFDIFFSIFALMVLIPIFFPLMLVLKLTGEGEVFFLQKRVGKDGNLFNLLKFATMLKNSPNIGTRTLTIKDDPRVLPLGKFLRKSKFNELPQLFNILKGDMSIIGPRPLTVETYNSYSESTKEILKKIKPGLSGIGSIIFRTEEELLNNRLNSLDFYNNIISQYKGLLEEWFFAKKSLSVYFILILITIWIVFFPSTKIVWKIFPDLPKPPKELSQLIY